MSSMLTGGANILQMCSFEANKSTKGASKLRRDLINAEIANLRDLLPLPSSTRQRLSQLQLMALVCVYVRKANYFQHVFRKRDVMPEVPMLHFGFSKAMSGFLMMMTQNGKLLYISDNAAEYLGHSMEDLLIHGDSVYDIIEKQDHQGIQAELMRSPNPLSLAPDTRLFLCRMNVSRNARRQMRFGDQKVVLVQGHFVSYLPLCSRNEPVFLATCTPVAMPETRECVVQGSTSVFTSIHSMDMKFLHLDRNGEFHLGYQKSSLQSISWYELVHWEHLREAQSKHRLITQSEQERSCILLVRLQTSRSGWLWIHAVLQVKDGSDSSQQPVIVCTNQVLSDREAAVMRANSWLYQYYSLHSKMHYGLAYEATRLPAYYPTAVMPYPPPREHPQAPAPVMAPHSPYTLPPHHLNGAPVPQHPHHHPGVLQYAGNPGNLTYSNISCASPPSPSERKWNSAGLKRPVSPPCSGSPPVPKAPRPSYGAFSELAPLLPSAYYGGPGQVLAAAAAVPVPAAFRAPSKLPDDRLADVEQSLTPTNTEDVSQMIAASGGGQGYLRPTYVSLDDPEVAKAARSVAAYPGALEPPAYYPRYLELSLTLELADGKEPYAAAAAAQSSADLREGFLYHRGAFAPPRLAACEEEHRQAELDASMAHHYWHRPAVVGNGGCSLSAGPEVASACLAPPGVRSLGDESTSVES